MNLKDCFGLTCTGIHAHGHLLYPYVTEKKYMYSYVGIGVLF